MKDGDPFKGKTLAFDIAKNIIVLVMFEAPSDSEWKAYCRFCAHNGPVLRGIVAWAEKGIPNPLQRAEVKKYLIEPPKLAMLTTSWVVRGAIKAFNWMPQGERLRCFDPDDVDGYSTHLGLSELDRLAIAVAKRGLEAT